VPPVSNTVVIDLTEEETEEETKEETEEETEEETDDYQYKKKLISDDDYNQLLFESSIHIWKKYANKTSKWYSKTNEADIKYIISQLLPINIKITNDLFMKYKGVLLDRVPYNDYEDVLMARELRPSIYNLINDIYNKIKNSYKDGVNNAIIV
jgi:hypothetical protein